MEAKKARMRELVELLNQAGRAYYQEAREIMSNYEYDKLYDQAQATVDMDEKFKLYGQMQKILADEGASVFIEDPANLIAIKKGYTGFVTYPVSAIDLASIKVAE